MVDMAKRFKKVVELPEFDERTAYNSNRKINGLIRTQLVHLHMAENLAIKPEHRTGININDLLTEADASQYVAAATALLHADGTKIAKPARNKKRSSKSTKPKKKKASSAKSSSSKARKKTKVASRAKKK